MENEFISRRFGEKSITPEIPTTFPLVCVVGHIASGKDEAMDILQRNFGIEFISASQPIVDYAESMGTKPRKREDWWRVVQEMRSIYGKDILGKMAYGKVNEVYLNRKEAGNLRANGFSMNGFRLLEDVNYLKAHSHTFFIGLEANKDLRYERLIKRNRSGDVFNRCEFEEREVEEGEGIDQILTDVDVVIRNEGSLNEFENNINTVIKYRYPQLA